MESLSYSHTTHVVVFMFLENNVWLFKSGDRAIPLFEYNFPRAPKMFMVLELEIWTNWQNRVESTMIIGMHCIDQAWSWKCQIEHFSSICWSTLSSERWMVLTLASHKPFTTRAGLKWVGALPPSHRKSKRMVDDGDEHCDGGDDGDGEDCVGDGDDCVLPPKVSI